MKIGVIGRGIILKRFKEYNFDVIDLDEIGENIERLNYEVSNFKDKSHIILCPAYSNIMHSNANIVNDAMLIFRHCVLPANILGMIKDFKCTTIAVSSSDLYNINKSKPSSELKASNMYYATKMVYDYLMQNECDLVVRHSELMDDTKSVENIIYRVCTSKYAISDFTNVTVVDDLICAIVSAIKKRITGVLNYASHEHISEYSISEVLGVPTIPMDLDEWGEEFKVKRQMGTIDCSKTSYIHTPRIISYELVFDYMNTIVGV